MILDSLSIAHAKPRPIHSSLYNPSQSITPLADTLTCKIILSLSLLLSFFAITFTLSRIANSGEGREPHSNLTGGIDLKSEPAAKFSLFPGISPISAAPHPPVSTRIFRSPSDHFILSTTSTRPCRGITHSILEQSHDSEIFKISSA